MYGTADRETVKEKRKIRHFLALVTMTTNPIIPSGNSLSPRHAWKRVYILSLEQQMMAWMVCLSNDPAKVDSNFLSYAATVLSPHRNVLIFYTENA